jgi:hypothetical protein
VQRHSVRQTVKVRPGAQVSVGLGSGPRPRHRGPASAEAGAR